MPVKANREIVEWEVGVKNRKGYVVISDQMSAQDYDGRLVFKLRGQIVMVVAHQKWDYVRRVTPFQVDAASKGD